VNIDTFLKEIKQELKEMGAPDPEHHTIDCASDECFLCAIHDTMPTDKALVCALFVGHDIALDSPEVRLHVLCRHFCKLHIALVYQLMKVQGRDSIGK
jgi:hypothetical protein